MSMAPVLAAVVAIAAGNPTKLDCSNPIPPIDNVGDHIVYFEQATASGPASDSLDVLKQRARADLVARLCTLDGSVCASLAAHVKDWQIGGDGKHVACAQAVVSRDELEQWRRALQPALEEELHAVAQRAAEGAKSVVIRGIEDGGTPGGARATWFLNRFEAALSSSGVNVVNPPQTWNGAKPYKPAERILRCELVQRMDPVKQQSIVEATWKSSTDGTTWKTLPPVQFPAAMAPNAPLSGHEIRARGDDLVLRVASRADGSLCHGERTQIYVTNNGRKPLHVRVLNLDSRGNVLVLFPNDQRSVDVVAPGQTIALADDPFEIEGAVGERERYVVLGATNPGDLLRFARQTTICRFKPDEAARLQDGVGLYAPQVAASGFTVLDDPICAERPGKADDSVTIGLEQLPWCL